MINYPKKASYDTFFTIETQQTNVRSVSPSFATLAVVLMVEKNLTTTNQWSQRGTSGSHLIFPDRWTFVCITYKAGSGRLEIFVDLELSGTRPAYSSDGFGPVVLKPDYGISVGGVAPGNDTAFTSSYYSLGISGNVDDVRMFDHVLSATEMRNIYFGYAHLEAAPSNLVAPKPLLLPNDLSKYANTSLVQETSLDQYYLTSKI